jgi:hypothetical protein
MALALNPAEIPALKSGQVDLTLESASEDTNNTTQAFPTVDQR